jgi:hypothetical protein
MRVVALGHLGHLQEARAAFAACEAAQPGYAAQWIGMNHYRAAADNTIFTNGLRKAGIAPK